jgi:hypothetical protein
MWLRWVIWSLGFFLPFCNFLPFEEDLSRPFFPQFRIFYTQGWFIPSLIEIGLLVVEKFFFFNINICKYGFPYCGSTRPLGPLCKQFWICIISEGFHLNMTYSGPVVLEKKTFKWPHLIFIPPATKVYAWILMKLCTHVILDMILCLPERHFSQSYGPWH